MALKRPSDSTNIASLTASKRPCGKATSGAVQHNNTISKNIRRALTYSA
jgi:hypothetical protein